MTTVIYMRPSGSTLEVNDTPETRALAEANGWVIHKPVEKAPKKAKEK